MLVGRYHHHLHQVKWMQSGVAYVTLKPINWNLKALKQKHFSQKSTVPAYDELIFVANANTYDKIAIQAFNKALEKATTYIVNHPQASWKEFAAYAPDTLNNELNKRAWNDTLTRFALRPSAVDLKRYDDYAEFMYSQKIIKTLPKAQDYVPTL